ncbi:MAG: hypothetical protein NVSMB7_14810 [Chitinophagaceae bacterium]
MASQSNASSSQIAIASSTIKQRQVDVADAKLTLSYTVITAPEDGLISKVNVQEGQKETQFDKMKTGQKVIVHADAFPDHTFEATVASFAAATGARFALLPPDNSSGNFVKVVQRLPVKIQFTQPSNIALKSSYQTLDYTIGKQAAVLSYMDVFLYLGILFLVCIPFVLLVKGGQAKKVDLSEAVH